MPGPLGMIGAQAAGAGLGLLLQGQQDRRQIRQQEKLQQLEIAGQQEMTDYNLQKQMELWERTNYKAQMEQLKKAGLNPGLIYGMGGGGGATTNVETGKVGAGTAPTGGGEIQGMMGMGLALQQAQIENIKASTEKVKAETGAVAPTIQKTTQETVNLKTQNALHELEKAFQEKTFENRASIINLTLSKLNEEVSIIENNREISDATKKDQISQIGAQLANTLQDTLNKAKQNAKTDAEIKQINKAIEVMQQQLDLNKIDQEMAKDGLNPKTGVIPKIIYNILKLAGIL